MIVTLKNKKSPLKSLFNTNYLDHNPTRDLGGVKKDRITQISTNYAMTLNWKI